MPLFSKEEYRIESGYLLCIFEEAGNSSKFCPSPYRLRRKIQSGFSVKVNREALISVRHGLSFGNPKAKANLLRSVGLTEIFPL
jgi:hypothetical protein